MPIPVRLSIETYIWKRLAMRWPSKANLTAATARVIALKLIVGIIFLLGFSRYTSLGPNPWLAGIGLRIQEYYYPLPIIVKVILTYAVGIDSKFWGLLPIDRPLRMLWLLDLETDEGRDRGVVDVPLANCSEGTAFTVMIVLDAFIPEEFVVPSWFFPCVDTECQLKSKSDLGEQTYRG
jgi:hypothetical protein